MHTRTHQHTHMNKLFFLMVLLLRSSLLLLLLLLSSFLSSGFLLVFLSLSFSFSISFHEALFIHLFYTIVWYNPYANHKPSYPKECIMSIFIAELLIFIWTSIAGSCFVWARVCIFVFFFIQNMLFIHCRFVQEFVFQFFFIFSRQTLALISFIPKKTWKIVPLESR